jgi:competence protein ComEA
MTQRAIKKSFALFLAGGATLLLALAAARAHAAPPPSPATSSASAGKAAGPNAPSVAGATSVPPAGVVNINTASEDELTRLPGVGPSKATAIVAFRTRHGKFARIDDLGRVKGFGRKSLLRLKPNLTVEGPTTLAPKKGAHPATASAASAASAGAPSP